MKVCCTRDDKIPQESLLYNYISCAGEVFAYMYRLLAVGSRNFKHFLEKGAAGTHTLMW